MTSLTDRFEGQESDNIIGAWSIKFKYLCVDSRCWWVYSQKDEKIFACRLKE